MKSSDFLRNTKLAVTLIRSTIGTPKYQRGIVKALGFQKPSQTVVHKDGPAIWGKLEKVIHLVKIERIHAEHGDKVPKKAMYGRKEYGLTRWPDLPYH